MEALKKLHSITWKQLFLEIAVIAILLLAFREAIRYFDPITAVKPRMSLSEVTQVMGTPLKRSQVGDFTVYIYPKAKIYFRAGQVAAIATDTK